jgi:hypothetical protein
MWRASYRGSPSRLKERIESLQTGLANLEAKILPPPRNKTASVVFKT